MAPQSIPTLDFLVFTTLALMTVGILLLSEWAVAQRLLRPDSSRHLVHLVVGMFVVIALITLESPIWLYVSALLTLVVTVVSREKGWIRSIHDPGRRSVGTITFPLALLLGLVAFWFDEPVERYPLALAFSVLAVSDPLAAIVGTRLKHHPLLGLGPKDRTLAGSAAFGVSAWLIVGLWMTLVGSAGHLAFGNEWIWHMAALVSLVATAVEIAGRKGWDNLFLVIAIVLVVVSVDSDETVRFLGWCVAVAIAFSLAALGLRFLNPIGAVLTGLMGGAMLFFGGWAWIAPPVAFFLSASLASVWGSRRRGRSGPEQVRGGRRDGVQVMANGGIGLCLVVLDHFLPIPGAYWLFAGAFAAAAADTFATEVGTAFRGVTRSIVTGQRVEPGTSGGVSVSGTSAALIGALIVAAVASIATGGWSLGHVLLITVAGFVASLVDSLLGATVQARYRTPGGSVTDAAMTNAEPNELIGGLRFVSNDTVNFLCTAAGVVLVAAALFVL